MPTALKALVVLLALAAGATVWSAELEEDKPTVPPPRDGQVGGVITPADKVESVSVVSRHSGKRQAAKFDAKTGAFTAAGLGGDASYDVCVKTTDGRNVEGIDLEFADARYLRLAAIRRSELGLPSEPAAEFTADDAQAVLNYARDLTDFMEIKRPLYVQGHGRRATMLVELMRTREFYSSGGDIIWRVELWYFENNYGGWDRLPNQERVLHRERVTPGVWSKIDVEYYPELSVHIDSDGKSAPVKFAVPDKPDPSRGRPAGTQPELKTKPHILGATSQPASASAPAG